MSEETMAGLDEREKRLVEAIADEVVKRVALVLEDARRLSAMDSGAGGSRCTITGLRRRQFERFCQIMRERPTEAPFRAAKAAIAELGGRGGYTRASSLQRYAGKHRKCW